MEIGCTGERTDRRGVSNIVGVALLVGLVIAGAFVVVYVGTPTLNDVSSQSEKEVAQNSMQKASSRIASMSGSTADQSTSFTFPNKLSGNIGVNQSAEINITVRPTDTPSVDPVSENMSLGTIYYEQDGEVLALQAGGVWQRTGDSVRMVNKPSLRFEDGQLQIQLTDIQQRSQISKGEIVATRDLANSQNRTRRMMSNLSTVWQDSSVDAVDVSISIESEFAEGWSEYAGENLGDHATVSMDGQNEVSLTFTNVSAGESSTGSAAGVSPTTSTSAPSGSTGPTSVGDSSSGETYNSSDPSTSHSSDTVDSESGSPSTSPGAGSDSSDSTTEGPSASDSHAEDTTESSSESAGTGPGTSPSTPDESTTGPSTADPHSEDATENSSEPSDPDPPSSTADESTAGPSTSDSHSEDTTESSSGEPDTDPSPPTPDTSTSESDPSTGHDESPESDTCNPNEDRNRGHGNDCDGVDEDNPGNSGDNREEVVARNETQTSDDDGDGVQYADDECPARTGLGSGGCPVVEGGDGQPLTIDASAGDLTYLGTQSGVVNETQVTSVEYRNPMDVAFVLDESGSMADRHWVTEREITSPGQVFVDEDQYVRVLDDGDVIEVFDANGDVDVPGWWLNRYTVDIAYIAPASDPTGERIDATRSFVDALNGSMDRAAAVQFSVESWTPISLTGNFDTFDGLSTNVRGGTNIAAGIENGLNQIDGAGADRNKVMVVLSDGQDNVGRSPIDAAEEAADESVTIYSVGLGDGVNVDQMQGIAQATGGQYYPVDNAGQLEETFEQIVADSQTSTIRAIDHQPLTMSVEAGSAGGSLGSSGFGDAINLNDPATVSPIDPSPRTYEMTGIDAGSTLSVTTTQYACGDRSDSGLSQQHDGETYVHRGCSIGSQDGGSSGYTAYTDGQQISEASIDWWQRSEAELLDDVGASIENGEVQLQESDQALIRTQAENGYVLMLFDAENPDRPPVAVASASNTAPTPGQSVTLDASQSYDPDTGDQVVEYKFGDDPWQDSATTTKSFAQSRDVTVRVKTADGQTDSTTISIDTANREPVAALWVDKSTVYEGEEINLNATDSYDPDDADSVDYVWGADASGLSGGQPTVTFTDSGTKTINLTVESTDGSATSTAVDVQVEDRDPVASLHVDDTTVSTGEAVSVNAYNSTDLDAGDTIEAYSWSDDAGSVGGDAGTVTFDTPGIKTLTLTVRNSDDVEETTSVTVEVQNTPPVANLVANKSTVYEGEPLALDATGSYDPDAGDSVDSYTWGGDASGLSGEAPTVTFTDSGTKTINLTVESTDGSATSTAVDVQVEDRDPAASLYVNDTTVSTGDAVSVNAYNSTDLDAGDTIKAYSWSDDAGSVNSDAGTLTFDATGTKTLTLTVRNSDDVEETTSVTVEVQNTPPVANLVANKSTVYEGEPLALDATGSYDPDAGDSVDSYTWGGDASGLSGEAPTATFTDNGTKTLTVTVQSTDESATSTAVDVQVEDRDPVASLYVDDTTVSTGEAVSINAYNSTDLDAGDTIEAYSWSNNASSVGGDAGTVTFDTPGTKTLTLTVENSDDVTATTNATVEVQNTPPVADLVANKSTVYEGEPVALNASGSFDPDTGHSVDSYTWGGDASGLSGEAPTATFTDNGTKTMAVTVQSTDGTTASTAVDVQVEDRAPTASLYVDDASVGIGESVTVDASNSTDVDAGDDITDYRWSDDASISDGTATDSLSFSSAGSKTLTVTVENSDGLTETANVTVEVIGNSVAADLVANKSTVYEGEPLQVDASGSEDPDSGQSVTDHRWSDDAAVIANGTATDSISFSDDGTKTLTVTVESTDGSTESTSVDVVVEDRDPVASMWLNDTSVAVGETVRLGGRNSTDPDAGDTITGYTWSDDASSLSGDRGGLSFSSAGTKTLTLTVENSDGEGATISRDITVIDPNQAPTAKLIADPDTGEQSTVFINGTQSTDPDGDSLSYSWSAEDPSGASANIEDGPDASPGNQLLTGVDTAGAYVVSMTVSDGSETQMAEVLITYNDGATGGSSPVEISVVEVEVQNG